MLQPRVSPGDASSEEILTLPIAAPGHDVPIDTPIEELGQIIMDALEETDQRIQYVTTERGKTSGPSGRRATPTPLPLNAQGSPSMSYNELFERLRARVTTHCLPSESEQPRPSFHQTFHHLVELHRSGIPNLPLASPSEVCGFLEYSVTSQPFF